MAANLKGFFSNLQPARLPRVLPELTEREREVLNLIARGFNNAEIAGRLDDTGVVMLDAKTGTEILSFPGMTAPIVTYQLSGDGEVLVAGLADGSMLAWNAGSGEVLRRFSVGAGSYTRFEPGRELMVAISPDGRLAVARAAGLAHVWDLESGEELYRFELEHIGLNQPQFADHGRLLAASTFPMLSLWDLATGREVEHHVPPGGDGVLSPDGRLYAQGWLSGEGEASIGEILSWDLATGTVLRRLTGHKDSAGPVAFREGGRQLITWGFDATVRVWDVASGRELRVLAGHYRAHPGHFPLHGRPLPRHRRPGQCRADLGSGSPRPSRESSQRGPERAAFLPGRSRGANGRSGNWIGPPGGREFDETAA